MRCISAVRAFAGFLACGCGIALCQGCNSDPGVVGGGSGGAGGLRVTFNLGLGGQTAVRARGSGGSGGIVADAAVKDALVARLDARTEGIAPDAREPPSKNADAPPAVDRTGTAPDARQEADQGAMAPDARQVDDPAKTRDAPGKEAGGKNPPPAIDASPHPDVGAPDEPPPANDAPWRDEPAVDTAAAASCSYGGVTYAVGDSFPNDCNTCFCLAGGEVVCTVRACSIDGGLAAELSRLGKGNTTEPIRDRRGAGRA